VPHELQSQMALATRVVPAGSSWRSLHAGRMPRACVASPARAPPKAGYVTDLPKRASRGGLADGLRRPVTAARARCCTSDITLEEFRMLRGKMDAFDPRARTPQEFLGGTANFRTDLYSGPTSGTLLTHKESIELFKSLRAKMTPELKAPEVPMPFNGLTQEAYAQKMIDEYKEAGVAPHKVFPQSFNIADVLYWVQNEPRFGKQAVFLDDANTVADLPSFADLAAYKKQGVNIWAPPTFALLALDAAGEIVPSVHARNAKRAGLDIITWTLERSGILADGNNGFYYQTIDPAIHREGDVMRVIDVLAKDVGILGVFSDWPATVTYYASCMGLK
jgi:glycerophosphoryl diester phosphodiesterase